MSVGAGFGVQLVHQVHDVEEAAALATADAGPGDADGKVGFAGPGAADEDDVTLMLEELSGGQIARQRFVTGVSSKLNSSTSLAKGSLAMVIWYLIERACFSLISAFSRSPTICCGSCCRFTAVAMIS